MTAALDALAGLERAERWIADGNDPSIVLPHIRYAHIALDDLIDRTVHRPDAASRLAVIDAVWNCGNKRGDAKWHGNRAYYGAPDGGLVDITDLIRVHPHLFDRDIHGCVVATQAGLVMLDQRDHDERHPWRAMIAVALGRRPASGVTSANSARYGRWYLAAGTASITCTVAAILAGHAGVGVAIALAALCGMYVADEVRDRRRLRKLEHNKPLTSGNEV